MEEKTISTYKKALKCMTVDELKEQRNLMTSSIAAMAKSYKDAVAFAKNRTKEEAEVAPMEILDHKDEIKELELKINDVKEELEEREWLSKKEYYWKDKVGKFFEFTLEEIDDNAQLMMQHSINRTAKNFDGTKEEKYVEIKDAIKDSTFISNGRKILTAITGLLDGLESQYNRIALAKVPGVQCDKFIDAYKIDEMLKIRHSAIVEKINRYFLFGLSRLVIYNTELFEMETSGKLEMEKPENIKSLKSEIYLFSTELINAQQKFTSIFKFIF